MTGHTSTAPDLTKVFPDDEVRGVAEKLLRAVPESVGEFPYHDADLRGIISNACRDEIGRMGLEDSDSFIADAVQYSNDHRIMPLLKEAGLVASGGCTSINSLYVQPRSDSK